MADLEGHADGFHLPPFEHRHLFIDAPFRRLTAGIWAGRRRRNLFCCRWALSAGHEIWAAA